MISIYTTSNYIQYIQNALGYAPSASARASMIGKVGLQPRFTFLPPWRQGTVAVVGSMVRSSVVWKFVTSTLLMTSLGSQPSRLSEMDPWIEMRTVEMSHDSILSNWSEETTKKKQNPLIRLITWRSCCVDYHADSPQVQFHKLRYAPRCCARVLIIQQLPNLFTKGKMKLWNWVSLGIRGFVSLNLTCRGVSKNWSIPVPYSRMLVALGPDCTGRYVALVYTGLLDCAGSCWFALNLSAQPIKALPVLVPVKLSCRQKWWTPLHPQWFKSVQQNRMQNKLHPFLNMQWVICWDNPCLNRDDAANVKLDGSKLLVLQTVVSMKEYKS